MDLVALRTEIQNDPLARGYAAMSDEQIAASLNTVNRTVNKTTVTTGEIYEAIVASEYDALSAAARARIDRLLSLGTVQVNGANTQATLIGAGAFGAGTATRANLLALARQPGSRSQELGLGTPTPSDVADARRQ